MGEISTAGVLRHGTPGQAKPGLNGAPSCFNDRRLMPEVGLAGTVAFGKDAPQVPRRARDDKGEGGDFYWEPSDRMGRKKQQVPPEF